MINECRPSCDQMKSSFTEIHGRAHHVKTHSQPGSDRDVLHSSPVSRQQILLLQLPMLKNWTGCQQFGTLNTTLSDKPASHDLQTGSVESPESPPPTHHHHPSPSSLHKEHISLPPFHSYANCKSCSSWKSSSFFFFYTLCFFFFFWNVQWKPLISV